MQSLASNRPQPARSFTSLSSLFMRSLHKQDKASPTTSSSSSSSSVPRLSRFLSKLLKRTYSFLQLSFKISFFVPPSSLKKQSHFYQYIVMSLLGFAVVINSLHGLIWTITKKRILNLASAVFFYSHADSTGDGGITTNFASTLLFAGQQHN
ncbi:hypothetical protein K435DRAFT_466108 [Dendrothele bispora CBS 962.96]|uniref:Uncharacterized protein n=1 Tax=Dendrothele bispora (strain CBS 962.96) TaxID=1314807 RepID=A0A4S8MC86_DENBC|nr:hypothetical protein K435DRAFT_466108 [Dendrothele bispora CBS 962.96]